MSGAITTAISSTIAGANGSSLAESVLVGAAQGAVAAGIEVALQQSAAVTEASAQPDAEKKPSGGPLTAEQKRMVEKLKALKTGEGTKPAIPLTAKDKNYVNGLIAQGRVQDAINYLVSHCHLYMGATLAQQTDEGLYHPDTRTITIGYAGYSWKGDVSAEQLYATLDHENVHALQDVNHRLNSLVQHDLNELEAYVHDLQNAKAYGLNQAQVADLESRAWDHFSKVRQPIATWSGSWNTAH